ncbi:hypothetical protein [Variovorax sp.]|jgi:hypothetical protein|uniref:hypothetical protein n=1 Tax=Variovorax sp. TaxID=1871043 RepID=UPI0011FB320F|nr:hypothetical protein [Variovorax sp.]TAJ58704.1 MAG: hypothetical protein EPO53_31130 [Variovorax sp.]
MGETCRVYGYLAEAMNPESGGVPWEDQVVAIRRYNEAVIESLPAQDDWPPLSRGMFSFPPVTDFMVAYGGRMIHFAAGLKKADHEVDRWLDKFERLIHRLYCDRVRLHIEFAWSNARTMSWDQKRRSVYVFDENSPPAIEWEFNTSMTPSELEMRWPNGYSRMQKEYSIGYERANTLLPLIAFLVVDLGPQRIEAMKAIRSVFHLKYSEIKESPSTAPLVVRPLFDRLSPGFPDSLLQLLLRLKQLGASAKVYQLPDGKRADRYQTFHELPVDRIQELIQDSKVRQGGR